MSIRKYRRLVITNYCNLLMGGESCLDRFVNLIKGDAERGVCVSTTVAGVSFEGDGERVSGGGAGVGSDEFDGGGMPGDTGDGSLTSGGGAGSVEPRC